MLGDFDKKLIVYPENLVPELKSEFKGSIAERTKMRRQKESDEENQKGQGLNILTPDQMLIRLPISLAQLKTGNNSEELKHEIRERPYYLYH